jgi:tetratricopeptide (TPR) repeat protein
MLMTQCRFEDSTDILAIRQQIRSFVCAFWNEKEGEQAANALGYLAGFDFVAPDQPLEWVIRWFEQVAQEHNLLLIVDNLQWADEQSVQLLERLAHALARTSTVILTAARPIFRIPYPQYMRSHGQYGELELSRLSSAQARELIDHVLACVERVPAAVPEMIIERAEGNPFFLYEYLDAMFESNIFVPIGEKKWRFNIILYDQAISNIPPALISVLQARLDELPADARQLLQAASIAGQQFWLTSLKAIYDYPSKIAGLLETLIMRGMIHMDEAESSAHDPHYHFSHALYREVAYEMLPRPQREQYHKRMAAWLLGNIAGKGDQYPLLAEQFLQAGQVDAALYTYVEAVEENMRLGRLRFSLHLIDHGLAIAKRLPREEALPAVSKLWAQRGQALLAIDRFDEASAASQSALMLLGEMAPDQLVTTRILAERILGLAHTRLGRFNDAYDALTRAHNLLPGSDTGQIAAVLRGFATLLLSQGRLEDSYAYQRRSANHAISSGDDQQIAASLSLLGMIDLLRGNLQNAWDCFQRTHVLNQKNRQPIYQATDMRCIGNIWLAVQDHEQALNYYEQGIQLLEGEATTDVLLNASYAFALLHSGQHLRGRTLLENAFEQGHRDVFVRMRLHLLYIAGFIQLQEYGLAQEQTLAYLQQYGKANMLIHGKVLYLRGYAGKMLGVPDAVSYARAALETEQAYGGLDLWMGHELLAQFATEEAEQQRHWLAAAKHLQERAESLRDLPELRAALFRSPRIRQIFTEARVSTADYDSLVASGVTSASVDGSAGG